MDVTVVTKFYLSFLNNSLIFPSESSGAVHEETTATLIPVGDLCHPDNLDEWTQFFFAKQITNVHTFDGNII